MQDSAEEEMGPLESLEHHTASTPSHSENTDPASHAHGRGSQLSLTQLWVKAFGYGLIFSHDEIVGPSLEMLGTCSLIHSLNCLSDKCHI